MIIEVSTNVSVRMIINGFGADEESRTNFGNFLRNGRLVIVYKTLLHLGLLNRAVALWDLVTQNYDVSEIGLAASQ